MSPESPKIYDFILELDKSISGDWDALVRSGRVKAEECEAFLDYAASFLSNVGNYYVRGHTLMQFPHLKLARVMETKKSYPVYRPKRYEISLENLQS